MGWKLTTARYVPLCCYLFALTAALAACLLVSVVYPTGSITGVVNTDVPPIDGEDTELFWFLHVSDLHISKLNSDRLDHLRQFVREVVPVVDPGLVVATGDLTDAVAEESVFRRPTAQQESEWQQYRALLDAAGLNRTDFWLDMRGNHDAYGVPLASSQNYFQTYGIQGASTNYVKDVRPANVTGFYRFGAVDLVTAPGMLMPFMIFGLQQSGLADFASALTSVATGVPRHTFLLGHYPRTFVTAYFPWGTVTPPVTAYLCGHLHSTNMYRRMPGNYLELEVADLKTTQQYRIMAIDHALVSFTDATLSDWPQIVVTNPKDAQFQSPNEPLGLMLSSTHIRVLVFSPVPITAAAFAIDGGSPVLLTQVNASRPLFTAPWVPSMYTSGLHTIEVTASNGVNASTVSFQFALDGLAPVFDYTFETFINGFPMHIFAIMAFTLSVLYIIGYNLCCPPLFMLCCGRPTTFKPWEAANNELLGDDEEVRPASQGTNVLTFGGDTLPRSGQTSLLREPLMEEHRYAHRADYDDLFHDPDPSFWQCIRIATQEHMDAVDNWPALQGFLLLAIGGVMVAVGPLFIAPQIDGANYGLIFSWGVIVINGGRCVTDQGGVLFTVESLVMALVILIFVYWPAHSLLYGLHILRAPVSCWTVFVLMLECMLTVGSTVAVSGTIYKFLGWEAMLFSPMVVWFELLVLIQATCAVYTVRTNYF